MSSPAFAAALQSVVLNKTPKPNAASSCARSNASPGLCKGDDLMSALVARISARRRRWTNTVDANNLVKDETWRGEAQHVPSDWSNPTSSESEGDFPGCPSPKRFAANIVKSIPWSNGRARINPLAQPESLLSGVGEDDANDAGDRNKLRSRCVTPRLFDQAADISSGDGSDKANCSNSSICSIISAGGNSSCISSLLQPEPLVLSDNITSRRGSRGNHVN
jgi:hypothetical protein